MSLRRSTRSGTVPLWKLRRWLPTVLATAMGIGGPVTWVLAQPTAPPPSPASQPKSDIPAKPPENGEKTVTVNFDGTPWENILDWYAKETGLIQGTSVKPTGSATIKPGAGRKFTLGEVTDLINEVLSRDRFILIEGPRACGKTRTAEQATRSAVYLDRDETALTALQVDPSLVLSGEPPQLVD